MSSIWTVRRSTTDTKVAGLCGGVAEHWGIDPVLVRVGWALLALSGGVGVVLYLAGWLLIPLTGRTSAPVDDLLGEGTRRWPKELWVALVVVACVATFAAFGSLSPFGVGPAVILACIWYFGFYRSRPPRATPPPAGPPQVTPFTEAADGWRRRIQEHQQQYGAAAPPAAAPPPPPPTAGLWPTLPSPTGRTSATIADPGPELAARTAFLSEPDPVGLYTPAVVAETNLGATALPRRRGDRLAARRLRLACLVVLGLVLAGLGFADQSGLAVTPAIYAATALLVVGLTLIAATWLGRARGLLPLGLLLVPVVVATAAFGPVTHLDHWASTTHSYTAVSQLPEAGDSQQTGQLTIDLSKLATKTNVDYTAHLGTGRLEVVVPPGADVVVDYEVGFGEVQVDGQRVAGGGHLVSPPAPTNVTGATNVLTLHLSVDQGQLEVRR